MFAIGPIGFAAPWLLLGLLILPILWILLRAVPPAPIRRRFPGVALLLGLTDDENQTDRTPWWLLLLRLLAVAAVIIGFAGPVLNPDDDTPGTGPLLILADGTWADARDWERRMDRVSALVNEAGRAGRTVAIATLTDLPAGGPVFLSAEAAATRLPGLRPAAFAPGDSALTDWLQTVEARFDTFWLSDGLDRDSRADMLALLEDRGDVRVFESPRPILGLRPPRFQDGAIQITGLRAAATGPAELSIAAIGPDPAGVERQLATGGIAFGAGDTEATLSLALPPELRNRLTRFEISGIRSAGAVTLADDALRRREIALIGGDANREGLELLSPLHYLREALEPNADLISGTLADAIPANPDVIILADVAQLTATEALDTLDWVESGGLLVRFAGPRLAGSDVSRTEEDPLLPVRLRAGGRSVGGAMSWGEPKSLAPFAENSPFFGLPVPGDVTVTAQVMAQPDPTLADRVIAQLSDGTPFVTRKPVGDGQVVLFHVTANAEWSSVPLSGLFVQMLERLAVSSRTELPPIEAMEGTIWSPQSVLTAFGAVEPAGTLPGVPGEDLVSDAPNAQVLPGLYTGENRQIAVNVLGADATLAATDWPDRIPVEGLQVTRETGLKGWLLGLALLLLAVDAVASLALSGRLRGPRSGVTAALVAVALVLAAAPSGLRAQDAGMTDDFAVRATAEVVLAHVLTGNAQVDQMASRGLHGLSDVLFRRTAIEPAAPIGIDLERDELAFFPILYWPVTPDQPLPSADAYAKLNRYLRTGGMIVFDTRDANIAAFGSSSPEGRMLQALARPLDIPALEPLPPDHVLTRSFYLLQDFPGRYPSRDVWVEAAPPDAVQLEGMPFRNLNDGVTPVVIGGNDWASAWAIDESGQWMVPVGRGMAGERQRELAYRFGVNLVMHVLTGNYKSDQVHVPALLDRLGQ